MYRVPVVSMEGQPLMPTLPSRARKWLKTGFAVKRFNDLGQFYVQLTVEPSDTKTQPIAIGIDPGKLYSGVAVQSAKNTLFTAHLVLPFPKVKERMEQRKMLRRNRRGKRINRKLPFKLRAHRQKRFDNRRTAKLPPSIRANRELELRVVKELCQVFPISAIYYEYIKASGNKAFSPVMVVQNKMSVLLADYAQVHTRYGWETANMRRELKLEKDRNKSLQTPFTHAVDGVAIAAYHFLDYKPFVTRNTHGHKWEGKVKLTAAPFYVIKRLPVSRRQLHLMVPAKGGLRRKYGGTTTRHGVRKGDFVRAEKAGILYQGWVSGDTEKQISVSDVNWKRLGQFTASKVALITRSTGLICQPLVKKEGAFLPVL